MSESTGSASTRPPEPFPVLDADGDVIGHLVSVSRQNGKPLTATLYIPERIGTVTVELPEEIGDI